MLCMLVFQAPGTTKSPVIYGVETTNDGGSLSTRHVVATQDRSVLAVATVSFKHPENGYEHQPTSRGSAVAGRPAHARGTCDTLR